MRNPARLAAELSGRPLLMREASLPALAQMLGVEAGERGSPLSTFIGRARRSLAGRDETKAPTGPIASAPRWIGEPDAQGYGWVLKDGVAILEIDGPLMAHGFGWGDCWYHGYDTLHAAYEEMGADARVGAIWEVVRSPGGVVASGLPELAALKRGMRDAAGGKPIHSFLRDGYSAAYWVPSSSDRIDASRESGVGSIGAVVGWCGLHGMLAKDGIEYRAFKFGPRKTDGSPYEPLSESAAASLQAEIEQCGRWFVADVLAGRPNLTEAAVLATEAGCFFGDSDNPELSALSHGLIDHVLTERESFAAIRDIAAARLTGVSTPPSSSPPQAAPAAPAAAKETDMKKSAVLAAAEKAGLDKEAIKKLTAELPDEDESGDEEVSEDENTDEAASDENEDEAATGDDGEDDDAGEGDTEAAKISGSPLAAKHPALALAAISTNQTFAQFKASAAASGGSRPAAGQLSGVLAGAQRLGADATAPKKGIAPASASSTWAKNRAAALKR